MVAEWPASSTSGSGEANNDPDPGFEDDENKQNSPQSNGNCIFVIISLTISVREIKN